VRPAEALRVRAEAQGLGENRAVTVEEAVRRVVGLQAQDVRACRQSVRVRTDGLTRSDVDGAVAAGGVVRTWAMRGTLHMLAAEDVGWVVGLLGPLFAARLAGRRRQLGIDDDLAERGAEALRAEVAAAGPLTRAELVARIADRGVVIDPGTQAPAHLLAYAAMTGRIVRGPEAQGEEPTYVVAGEPVRDDDAVARLAARYLAGYGPATAEDFAAWSGLPLGRARAGVAAVATSEVTLMGEAAHLIATPGVNAAQTTVRLLAHFDAYLLGYRSRELAVPKEFGKRIQAGGGFVMPAVLVNGRAVGTWRQTSRKGQVMITIEPFTSIAKRVWPMIEREIADLGRFLGTRAALG
jgi:hypothetical protein